MVNEWIRHADQKISLLLAANALIGATVATLLTVTRNPRASAQTFVFGLFNEPPAATLCGFGAVLVFLSIFFCLLCILPRLSSQKMNFLKTVGSHFKSMWRGSFPFYGSPLYFIDIAAVDFEKNAEKAAFLAHFQTDEALSAALVAQIASVSGVARSKYRWTLCAVYSLVGGVACVFLAFLINYFMMKPPENSIKPTATSETRSIGEPLGDFNSRTPKRP